MLVLGRERAKPLIIEKQLREKNFKIVFKNVYCEKTKSNKHTPNIKMQNSKLEARSLIAGEDAA